MSETSHSAVLALSAVIEDATNLLRVPIREIAVEYVGNGAPISDMYSYTVSVAHGRRNHKVHTYDGGGPHESPALAEFIDWLRVRTPEPGPIVDLDVV